MDPKYPKQSWKKDRIEDAHFSVSHLLQSEESRQYRTGKGYKSME